MNIYSEAALYSMFDPTGKYVPDRLRAIQTNLKNEPVICVDPRTLCNVPLAAGRDFHLTEQPIEISLQKRNEIELYGTDIQVIVAACIHTDTRFMTLSLNHNPQFVDGYHCGSITYPQGHATIRTYEDRDLYREIWSGMNPVINLDSNAFVDILKENIEREIFEEIGLADSILSKQYKLARPISNELHELIHSVSPKNIYPIYINRAGSTGKHVCMLFDLEIPKQTELERAFNVNSFVSNETAKHSIKIFDYQTLLTDVESLDDICVWMQKSFSVVPFMKTTFLASALSNDTKK